MQNETRHALRALLKAVDKHLTRVAGNKQWRDEIVAQSRVPVANELDRQHRLSLMQDMLFWIRNIQEHTSLLKRYNIGKDADERNKEMVAAVAKRVGFKLPEGPEDVPTKPAKPADT